MYGCRRSPNRKLNHTNLICGRGNQITCFGCSADDEFIFVTKLSWQRKKGVGETAYVLCNKASAGGGGDVTGLVSLSAGEIGVVKTFKIPTIKLFFFLLLFLTAVSERLQM